MRITDGFFMIPDSKKKSVVEKIIKSKAFRDSQTYIDLLEYLLKYHLKDETPTESIIAVEFYKWKSAYNSSEESTVRLSMYRLRIKLKHYYKKEGKEDDVIITIPKGHYEMQFSVVEKKENVYSQKVRSSISNFTNREKVLTVLVSLFGFWIVLLLILKQHPPQIENPISTSDPIWNSFFDTEYPINIVFGDFFVFDEKDIVFDKYRRIMDFWIDSHDDYLEYKANNPERETRNCMLNELPHNSIYNIKDIMHLFYSFNKTFEIKFSHSFELKDLKNSNYIYIGDTRNLQMLGDLIDIIPLYINPIKSGKHRFTVFSDNLDTLKKFETKNLYQYEDYNLDYGLLIKLPGLNGETYFYITGFGYMAQVELVKILSTKQKIEVLENQIKLFTPDIPDYFYAIFAVSGYKLSGYSTELQFLKEIDADKYKQSFRQLLTHKK